MEPVHALVTRDEIERDLVSLGVRPGDTLVVHSSLKSLGFVVGGAQTVIDALLTVLGPDGTLVMPAQSGGNSEPSNWVAPPVPKDWWPVLRDQLPAFDPQRTPLRNMGAIPDCFRSYPGVLRSNHPLDSFIASGRYATELTSDHPLDAGLGEGSPTERLYNLGARILLIGVSYDRCTVMHLAEYQARSRIRVPQGMAVLQDGQRVWHTFMDLSLDSDEFTQPGELFESTGRVRRGKVGQSDCRLFNVREIVDATTNWLTENRHHRIVPSEIPAIMSELKQSPVENIFAIGDIETFGLDEDFFDVLVLYHNVAQPTSGTAVIPATDSQPQRLLDSLVLRYHESLILASPADDCRIDAIVSAVSHPSVKIVSGRASLVEKLQPHLTEFQFRRMFLLAIDRDSFDGQEQPDTADFGRQARLESFSDPELATIADLEEIVRLFYDIPEFNHSGTPESRIAQLKTAMERDCSHFYIQRHNGQIISMAGTTAENSVSAMIVSVGTHSDYRGLGLASRLVSTLCDQMLGTRFQTLALFYDNPDAGRIYRRLGFDDAGDWMMAQREEAKS